MVGEKLKLTATVNPNTAKNKNVKWTTSNSKVATVSSTGDVTAVGAGNCNITVTTDDNKKTATASITVKDVSISLDKKEINLLIGSKAEISYVITPETIANKEVTWSSSDTTIATVDSKGVITGLKEGTVKITATTKTRNKTASITVNVNKLDNTQKIKVNNLKQENDKLSKIGEKVKPDKFKKNFELSSDLEVIVKNSSGTELKDTEYVGTGTLVQIRNKQTKKVLQDYECLIYGDVNGDGKISAMDYTLIENNIMKIQLIENANKKKTADVNEDGKISAMDYTLIENHIMGIQKIQLK